jgi:hypothetical protein
VTAVKIVEYKQTANAGLGNETTGTGKKGGIPKRIF